ncbi:MAG TPA: erythromycin esterase family protein [Tepidisphaeraceae bacterium]
MTLPFRDRRDAGRQLAAKLLTYANRPDVIVLGLPRGGVPVADEVAETLGAPLDAFLVRKLGVPGHEELAMGAIAAGGVRVLNDDVIGPLGIPAAVIDAVEAAERRELARRERLYRGGQPPLQVADHTVILVDDGLATGSTMRAAARALRQLRPARLVAATPVGSTSVGESLRDVVDAVVCAEMPEPFYAVGVWYDDFGPTADAEVQAVLRRAAERQPALPSLAPPAAIGVRPGPTSDIETVRTAAEPLLGDEADYDRLLDLVGEARFVLIGEASHGTHEFYRERAWITRRLIEERGFTAVAVEADWPDAYRINRYVRGTSDDPDAAAALGDFQRFPRWMWRNADVLDFVAWLRAYNDRQTADGRQAGFYGLDLYSLHTSIQAVLGYLDQVDPDGAVRARARYTCFDHFGDDPQVYGYATTLGLAEPCENEAVGQLVELQRRAGELARVDGAVAEDELFFAIQNARLAKNAEAYYRAMFHGRIPSWNLRDRHMAETLEALVVHLERQRSPAKIVVWAHNSHLGDARATAMVAEGELNLGQLVRERHGQDALLIGFSTYAGTVTAAANWDEPARQRHVRPGLPGSYEALFHAVGERSASNFLVPLRGGGAAAEVLRAARLQRAIGVIYRPETERFSHYFLARLADQFDAVLHFDQTRALVPLDPDAGWETPEELPETFPFGV